jgi:hypothetical protein
MLDQIVYFDRFYLSLYATNEIEIDYTSLKSRKAYFNLSFIGMRPAGNEDRSQYRDKAADAGPGSQPITQRGFGRGGAPPQ